MALRGGEDDEPWLASAEPDGRETYVSRRQFRVMGLLIGALVLLVAALVYAVIAKPAQEDDTLVDGEVPLIRAPETPFRTKPDNPGGMDVEGVDQTTYEAAGGVDPQGELALDQIPEEPMERPMPRPRGPAPEAIQPAIVRPPEPAAPPRAEAPLPAPRAAIPPPARSAAIPDVIVEKVPEVPVVKKPVQPKAPPPKVIETPKPSNDRLKNILDDVAEDPMPKVSGGDGPASLQLGAFSSNAKAEAAWKNFQRYGYLSGLTKSILKVEREEGEPLYRLRATGVESRSKAQNLCARLKVAGEKCVVAE